MNEERKSYYRAKISAIIERYEEPAMLRDTIEDPREIWKEYQEVFDQIIEESRKTIK